MAKINLITNTDNKWGLSKDARLLGAILHGKGHSVSLEHWTKQAARRAALNIHLELVGGIHFTSYAKNIYIPNPEWCIPQWMSRAARFDVMFAKTRFTERVFSTSKFREIVYTGFTSEDRWRPGTKKKPKALHLAGNSMFKNTIPLVEQWKQSYPPLTVVASNRQLLSRLKKIKPKSNVTIVGKHLPDETITEMLNGAMWVVQPSASEGFGHCIVEAMAVGAVVIGLDAPPMNEFPTVNLPARQVGVQHFGKLFTIEDISPIERAFELRDGSSNRQWYLENDKRFEQQFITEVENILNE